MWISTDFGLIVHMLDFRIEWLGVIDCQLLWVANVEWNQCWIEESQIQKSKSFLCVRSICECFGHESVFDDWCKAKADEFDCW